MQSNMEYILLRFFLINSKLELNNIPINCTEMKISVIRKIDLCF